MKFVFLFVTMGPFSTLCALPNIKNTDFENEVVFTYIQDADSFIWHTPIVADTSFLPAKSWPSKIDWSVYEPPQPVGGLPAIMQKVIYPIKARRFEIEGRVVLKCFLDKTGSLKIVMVIASLTPECDEAAIDAVRGIAFIPGKINGQPAKTTIFIPILFKLDD